MEKDGEFPGGATLPALLVEKVDIDGHCTGSRWSSTNLDELAKLTAIVAMGQATHAAKILAELLPLQPALNHEALRSSAKKSLSIKGETRQQQEVSRFHRDGLIFETISWAAAYQGSDGKVLLRDPHLSATSQGLDGLMIELDAVGAVSRATIFEDKCSEDPRSMFRDKIMPAFKVYHENRRAPELLAAAAALLSKVGLNGTQSAMAAASVLDKKYRAYRGGLAVTTSDDSHARRKLLFKDYGELKGIKPDQRIGAVLITSNDLRAWFDDLALRARKYIDSLVPSDV